MVFKHKAYNDLTGKEDLTNKVLGRLIVLCPVERDAASNFIWLCVCRCGKYKEIRHSSLMQGGKSCGSPECRKALRPNFKHGMKDSKLYSVYHNMLGRCYNTNCKYYEYYGGRGITVCDEWRGPNGFINFRDWSERSSYEEGKGLSIDRIDVNGNYCEENCRWATVTEQNRNQQKAARKVDLFGESLYVREAYDKYLDRITVDIRTIHARLSHSSWTVEDCFFLPKKVNQFS